MVTFKLLSRSLLLASMALLPASAARPADGDLDLSFGAGIYRFGYRTTSISRCALLRQPDGALLIAGYAQDGVGPFLARLGTDGELDPAFGSGGVVPAGPGYENAGVDLALQPDGKILLACAYANAIGQAFVMRFDAAGSPDLTFGAQGMAYSGQGSNPDGAVAIATSQGGQGNVYLAAHDFFGDVNVVRFDSSGVLSASFGVSGVAHPDFVSDRHAGLDMALESGILLATYDDYTNQACVTRFAWNGIVDLTFGGESSGQVHSGLNTPGYADVALDVLPGGRIVLGGYTHTSQGDFVLRLDADGIPDPSFGTAGLAFVNVTSDPTCKLDLVALENGGVAIAGVGDAVPPLTYLAVFESTGTPDPDFGTDGVYSLPIRRGWGADVALAAQPDGALVMVGSDEPVERLFVTRIVPPGGLDESFNSDGIVHSDIPAFPEFGRALAIQGNGSVLLASHNALNDVVRIQRFDSTGLRDPNFGSQGYTELSGIQTSAMAAISIVTQSGTHQKYIATHDINVGQHCIARLVPDGNLDPTWGTDGITYTGVDLSSSKSLDLALQADGKVLLALNCGDPWGGVCVVRFDTNGQIDPSFDGGIVAMNWTVGWQARVAVESSLNGNVYVAAVDATLGTPIVSRLTNSGSLDTSFGEGGIAACGAPGLHAVDLSLVDSGVLLASVDWSAYQAYVARFMWDGTLDPSFGLAGTGISYTGFDVFDGDPIAMGIEPEGWIYLAGDYGWENYVVRFFPDGIVDSSFGSNGIATTGGWFPEETVVDLGIQGDGKVVLATYTQSPDRPAEDVLVRFQASAYGQSSVPELGAVGRIALGPFRPNPFRCSLVGRFSLPADGYARATIHDLQGRLVGTLIQGTYSAGSHLVQWSGRDRFDREVAPGVYFVRLECANDVRVCKVTRLRD